MKISTLSAALVLGGLSTVNAAPVWMKSELQKKATNDLQVLEFAGFLEELETQFYGQLVSKFSVEDYVKAGFKDDAALVQEQVIAITNREFEHVAFVEANILGAGGNLFGKTCKFDFTSALKDLPTALATAQALEITGTGGIAGGILTQLQDKSILQAAAQILPVEARHNSILNTFNNALYTPNAFEISLTRASVLSIAQGFVVPGSCDIPSGLGVTPQTALTITPTTGASFTGGSHLSFTVAGKSIVDSNTFCAISIGGQSDAIVLPSDACVLPDNFTGPAFVYLITGNKPFTQDVNKQDPTQIYAGPNAVIVNTSDKLAKLVDEK